MPAPLEVGGGEVAGDDDQARAAVGVGPGVEGDRRMEDMLDAVNDDRALLADQVEDALHSQQVGAALAPQPAEPERDLLPVERRVEGEAEGADPAVVAVDVVRVPVMRHS